MKRLAVLFLAALISTTALSPVAAQDRYGGDRGQNSRDRTDRQRPSERERPNRQEERRISASEALSIARSRARGAQFVGSRPSGGDTYVFRFERDGGQLFDVTVDARTGRAGGG